MKNRAHSISCSRQHRRTEQRLRAVALAVAFAGPAGFPCAAFADDVPPSHPMRDWLQPDLPCETANRCEHGRGCPYHLAPVPSTFLREDCPAKGSADAMCATDAKTEERRKQLWWRVHRSGVHDDANLTDCEATAIRDGMQLECFADTAVYCAPGDTAALGSRIWYRGRLALVIGFGALGGLAIAAGIRMRRARPTPLQSPRGQQ